MPLHPSPYGGPVSERADEYAQVGPGETAALAEATGELLGRLGFTARLPPPVRARLEPLARVLHFPAGSRLLAEGEPMPWLGIVARGRVALRTVVPERGEVTILTVEPGDVVGWSALVAPYVCTAGAVSVTPVDIAAFDAEALRGVCRADPAFAAGLYLRLLGTLGRRLGATRMQLLDVFGSGGGGEAPW